MIKQRCLVTAYTDPSFRGNTAYVLSLLSLQLKDFVHCVSPMLAARLNQVPSCVDLCKVSEEQISLFRRHLPPFSGHRLVKPGMILGQFLAKARIPDHVDLVHAYNKVLICDKPCLCSFDTSPFDSARMWGLPAGQEIDYLTRSLFRMLYEEIFSSQIRSRVAVWSQIGAKSFTMDIDTPHKIVVLPPFVKIPPRKPKHKTRNEPPLVLMIGTQARRKGADVLVKAFEALGAGKCRLLIIGRLDVGLRRLIESNPSISNIPYVEHDTLVRRILPRADIFCLPSRAEGSPISILEAMALSVPVVATNVYGIPEEVQDQRSGLLVPVNDAKALGNALCILLDDPKRRRKMGSNGRRIVESRFSPEMAAARIEALYRQLS